MKIQRTTIRRTSFLYTRQFDGSQCMIVYSKHGIVVAEDIVLSSLTYFTVVINQKRFIFGQKRLANSDEIIKVARKFARECAKLAKEAEK